jgi:hypothetical protein
VAAESCFEDDAAGMGMGEGMDKGIGRKDE